MSQHRNDIFLKNVSAALKKARGEHSQAHFARVLGVSHQQTYQRYEEGKVMIPVEVLHRLANQIGVTMEFILRGDYTDLTVRNNPDCGVVVNGNDGDVLRDETSVPYGVIGWQERAIRAEEKLKLLKRAVENL